MIFKPIIEEDSKYRLEPNLTISEETAWRSRSRDKMQAPDDRQQTINLHCVSIPAKRQRREVVRYSQKTVIEEKYRFYCNSVL